MIRYSEHTSALITYDSRDSAALRSHRRNYINKRSVFFTLSLAWCLGKVAWIYNWTMDTRS
jgi:hypothetical protein